MFRQRNGKGRAKLMCLTGALALALAACSGDGGDEGDGGDGGNSGSAGVAHPDSGYEDGDVITLITGTDPGGGFDTNLRTIQPYLEEALAEQTGLDLRVVVENQPGAQQRIGIEAMYNAEPDGRTLGLLPTEIAAGHQVLSDARVDLTDMSYFGQLAVAQKAIMVPTSLELSERTFEGLVERSEEQPILWGNAGATTSWQLLKEILTDNGVELQTDEADFPGASELVASLLRGEIEAIWTTDATLAAAVEANPDELEIIAQTGCEAAVPLPDVPTLVDEEIPGAEEICEAADPTYRMFAGPPGIPDETAAALTDSLEQAITNADHVADAEAAGFIIDYQDPDACADTAQRLLDSYTEYQDRLDG